MRFEVMEKERERGRATVVTRVEAEIMRFAAVETGSIHPEMNDQSFFNSRDLEKITFISLLQAVYMTGCLSVSRSGEGV